MAKVTVYSTPTCPFCNKVKQFLKENNIEFEEIDVSSNQEKVQEMIQKSGQRGVPVTEIDGNMVVGYNVAKLKELLELE